MNYCDPYPARIPYGDWVSLFRSIPRNIRDSFHSLTGSEHQMAYIENLSCFDEFEGDRRLRSLLFDNSLASLRLWSFLLTEEARLHRARKAGFAIVGVMKDLGTASIIAMADEKTIAFYPDGAWWIPCVMEMSEGLLAVADSLGLGEEMCPARAALAAFVTKSHFPMPDLLVGAVGACCDDFSATMQLISDEGIPMIWWELPWRRSEPRGPCEITPTGLRVSSKTVDFLENQLNSVRAAVSDLTAREITDELLSQSIHRANRLRHALGAIRDLSYGTVPAPFPSLEAQICEMLALHFCSDPDESIQVLEHVREVVEDRVKKGLGVLPEKAYRCVWVNPVADLRVMNLFESLGGAVSGTEYLFRHALVQIPTGLRPLRALALTALCDPMIGDARYRARLIIDEALRYRAEGIVISMIPGASHCATESIIIRDEVRAMSDIPVLEISVPSLTDTVRSQLETRLLAFFEILESRRKNDLLRY